MSDFGRPGIDARITIGAMIIKAKVWIEGKFGQGKNGCELNKIRMRKSTTSEAMAAMIFFCNEPNSLCEAGFFFAFFTDGKNVENYSLRVCHKPFYPL